MGAIGAAACAPRHPSYSPPCFCIVLSHSPWEVRFHQKPISAMRKGCAGLRSKTRQGPTRQRSPEQPGPPGCAHRGRGHQEPVGFSNSAESHPELSPEERGALRERNGWRLYMASRGPGTCCASGCRGRCHMRWARLCRAIDPSQSSFSSGIQAVALPWSARA